MHQNLLEDVDVTSTDQQVMDEGIFKYTYETRVMPSPASSNLRETKRLSGKVGPG